MVWLYDQVTNLPSDIGCQVVASNTGNLDQFGSVELFCPSENGVLMSLLSRHSYRLSEYRRRRFIRRQLTERSILHSHFGDQGWVDRLLAVDAGVPHVVTFYGYDATRLPKINEIWARRFRELFAHASLVLAEGPFFARTLMDLGCPRSKLKIQHLGVRTDRIEFVKRGLISERRLKHILIAGSFVEKKGIPDAIMALAKLRHRGLKITIVGDEIDQDRSRKEKKRIVQALRETQLDACTTLVGFRTYEELLALSHSHDIFLAPSRTATDGDSEGGAPVTLMAMAATGIPIISTRHCDIPEVVIDGETGLLANEGDVPGISACLDRLLSDDSVYSRFSTDGRKRMETEFNSLVLGERLAAIYRNLDAGARR